MQRLRRHDKRNCVPQFVVADNHEINPFASKATIRRGLRLRGANVAPARSAKTLSLFVFGQILFAASVARQFRRDFAKIRGVL